MALAVSLVFLILLLNTEASIRSLDRALVLTMRALGAGPAALLQGHASERLAGYLRRYAASLMTIGSCHSWQPQLQPRAMREGVAED